MILRSCIVSDKSLLCRRALHVWSTLSLPLRSGVIHSGLQFWAMEFCCSGQLNSWMLRGKGRVSAGAALCGSKRLMHFQFLPGNSQKSGHWPVPGWAHLGKQSWTSLCWSARYNNVNLPAQWTVKDSCAWRALLQNNSYLFCCSTKPWEGT